MLDPTRAEAMNGAGTGVVALAIPARAEYVALCRLALTGLARIRALESEVVGDLKLALTEACSNAVRHAYEKGREGMVEIRYELSEDRIEVEIADEGNGFDPEVVERAEGLDEGGLGIAIIRAVTDELEIEVGGAGQGSRLRFTKYLR
jgi:serine/threonine-protein kinase RsbW